MLYRLMALLLSFSLIAGPATAGAFTSPTAWRCAALHVGSSGFEEEALSLIVLTALRPLGGPGRKAHENREAAAQVSSARPGTNSFAGQGHFSFVIEEDGDSGRH